MGRPKRGPEGITENVNSRTQNVMKVAGKPPVAKWLRFAERGSSLLNMRSCLLMFCSIPRPLLESHDAVLDVGDFA
jgi:hypothetical protein